MGGLSNQKLHVYITLLTGAGVTWRILSSQPNGVLPHHPRGKIMRRGTSFLLASPTIIKRIESPRRNIDLAWGEGFQLINLYHL